MWKWSPWWAPWHKTHQNYGQAKLTSNSTCTSLGMTGPCNWSSTLGLATYNKSNLWPGDPWKQIFLNTHLREWKLAFYGKDQKCTADKADPWRNQCPSPSSSYIHQDKIQLFSSIPRARWKCQIKNLRCLTARLEGKILEDLYTSGAKWQQTVCRRCKFHLASYSSPQKTLALGRETYCKFVTDSSWKTFQGGFIFQK